MTPPGKRALITGGSGGIGAAICRRLSATGLHVYINANRGMTAAQALATELSAAGGCAEAVQFDVTDAAATQAALDRILEAGPIQVLVNNAGIHEDAVFPAMNPGQWQRVIDVSLQGFYNVTQPLMMPMIRTRWGRIVNISSISGLIGNRGQVNYAAAKGAVNAATKALSLEVASRGITVNAVAPGIIATDMGNAAFDAAAIDRLVPMKRAGQPQEVAELVAFLASEHAGYITGQVISINGGII
jgi:3-oxoacyl-[acyl-carrier protein] reductase